jgi:hypothetical protein
MEDAYDSPIFNTSRDGMQKCISSLSMHSLAEQGGHATTRWGLAGSARRSHSGRDLVGCTGNDDEVGLTSDNGEEGKGGGTDDDEAGREVDPMTVVLPQDDDDRVGREASDCGWTAHSGI